MKPFPFLARLQLDAGADTRAIRRAYARELKLIDPAADPAAFQHLRECYERALAWAEHVAREDVAAPAQALAVSGAPAAPEAREDAAPVAMPAAVDAAPAGGWAPPPAAGPAPSDPAAQARLVLEQFYAGIPALLARPGEIRLEPWIEALAQAAADRRLEHLEARGRFEALVAGLLADGWRPGHELLFPAAVKVFGWDADRRALDRLEIDGAVLDAALDQQAAFLAQDVLARTRQREVLALLRKPEAPAEQAMWDLAGRLRAFVGQFPNLAVIVAPQDRIRHWLASCPEPAFGPDAPGQPKLDINGRGAMPGWPRWVFMILMMLYIFHSNFSLFGTDRKPPRLDQEQARVLEQQRQRPPPPVQGQPPTREQLDAIGAHMHYRPTPGTPAGVQETRVEIYLDDDGNMVGVKRLKTSSDPAFGEAVEKAVRDSGPFPRSVARVFELGLKVKLSYRRGAPVFSRTPAPWEARPPAALPRPPSPARQWQLYPDPPGTEFMAPGKPLTPSGGAT